MKIAEYRPFLLAGILIFAISAASASEVTMKNGDRVSGRIVEETESAVVIETAYAGEITIARKHIAKIMDPSSATNTPLANPSVKEPSPNTPKTTSEPPVVGKTTKPAALPKAAKRLFGGPGFGLATGWDGNFNIGFSYTSGNSNNTTMTTGLRAVKTGGRDNLTVYARSLWNNTRSSGTMTTTQNAFWGGVRYDRNLDEKHFGFISYDFERDRPKNLNFRSVAGGGLGRHIIRKETTEFDVLSGLAWNRTWQVGPNTDTPELLVGTTLKHKLTDRLKIQKTFTYYQNTTDRNEYRFLFDATLSADVTKRIGVFFTIGDRFNNDPIGTARRNDFLFTTGMKWNFGNKK